MVKKIIVLDTNVYGWYLSYTLKGDRKTQAVESFRLISKLLEDRKNKPQCVVLATERIEKEIKASGNQNLKDLLYSLIQGVIQTSSKIKELANEYYKTAKKYKARADLEDCEILAAVILSRIKWFITENRLTINHPRFKKAFEEINSKRKLQKLNILNSGEASHALA